MMMMMMTTMQTYSAHVDH